MCKEQIEVHTPDKNKIVRRQSGLNNGISVNVEHNKQLVLTARPSASANTLLGGRMSLCAYTKM